MRNIFWALLIGASQFAVAADKPTVVISEEARRIHSAGFVFDGHNDALARYAPAGPATIEEFFTRAEGVCVDLPRARGLALTKDGSRFLVSYNPSTELVMVDPATLEHRNLQDGPFWQKIPAWKDIDEATFLDHAWQAKNTITNVQKLLKALEGLVTPQFVADVQSMVNSPATNFGWCVLGVEAVADTVKRFDTREVTSAATRPQLTVVYLPPTVYDLNADNRVNAQDVAILLSAWGTAGPGDFNADGQVNSPDLAMLLGAWTG